MAAADLRTSRSTLLASFSFSVQLRASSVEVAGGRLVWGFDDIFTRTEQFDDGKRQIGKAEWVGGFLHGKETL